MTQGGGGGPGGKAIFRGGEFPLCCPHPKKTPACNLRCIYMYIVRTNTATLTDQLAEMHLQPEPLFSLPTDNVGMLDIQGTPEGRIFLGGKDGCLYEVVYQAEDGWFSRKCKKINHSTSMLSFLVPSFLSFSEEGTFCT